MNIPTGLVTNSVDPDQMPRFSASILGLLVSSGLPVPILKVFPVTNYLGFIDIIPYLFPNASLT